MNANPEGLSETEALNGSAPETTQPPPLAPEESAAPAPEQPVAETVAASAPPEAAESAVADAPAPVEAAEAATAAGDAALEAAEAAIEKIATIADQVEADSDHAEAMMEAAHPDEEPADAATEAVAATAGPARPFKRGDLIEATITSTSPTSVTLDVGHGLTGIIPGRELERMARDQIEMLREGETLTVFVVNPHDHHGDVVLSMNRAQEEQDWRRAEEYREASSVYESQVAGYNKGGLIVRFGRLRGFVPQSQISPDRRRQMGGETPEERYGVMVNQPIVVKVMEVDRARNRLILSERMAARESRESRKESLITRLQVGEVRTGRVVSLVDFGAFVDIGGAEGLVHLTELSWKHVTHPREFLKVGQEVKVEVISIDPDAKRIGLSMKRQEADPWDTIAINYQVGQLVQGVVTKMTKFGAFVSLVDVPEIEGLVHISELSEQRVVHPREVLQENDTVTLRVIKIDISERRLGLSLKRVNSAEYLDMDWFGGEG